MLKRLVTHALAQTSSSRAIASIRAVGPPSGTLGVGAFDTVLTITPNVIPNRSAAATRLALGDPDFADERDRTTWTLGARTSGKAGQAPPAPREDPRWQLLSIIRERSGVREVLDSL